MDLDQAKQRAAQAAMEELPEAGVIGLGSGSTTAFFIAEVGRAVRAGRRLAGVATSDASRRLAEEAGIPLLDDAGPWNIDVCVDGADEVSDDLSLIKGGGGCHAREKIVNEHSARSVIIVDATKLSQRLGERWAVPVEVLPFGREATAQALSRFGTVAVRNRDGRPWVTDSGNFIYDVKTGPIVAPDLLDKALRALPGVVETGLFLDRVDLVLVAESAGVRSLRRVVPR